MRPTSRVTFAPSTSTDKIQSLLELIDEMGIELINEDDAEARLLASGESDDEPEDELVDDDSSDDDLEISAEDLDDISRRIRSKSTRLNSSH